MNVVDALPDLAGTVKVTKGNLMLNRGLADTVNKITVTDGVLTLAEGVKIGKDAPLDGEVDLKDKGQLVLGGDLTLKELTTAEGSKITANGKTLTVNTAGNLTLNATVSGDLKLEMADGKTADLKKDVNGTVGFESSTNGTASLILAEGVHVDAVDFKTADADYKFFDLKLEGNAEIGRLRFAKTTDP